MNRACALRLTALVVSALPATACVPSLPLTGAPCPCPAGFCCQPGSTDLCVASVRCDLIDAGDAPSPDTATSGSGGNRADSGDAMAASPADATDGPAAPRPFVYLTTTPSFGEFSPTTVSVLDVTGHVSRSSKPFPSVVAMKYSGSLLVAIGSGYGEVSVLDPDTLEETQFLPLPWAITAAAFSPDGRFIFIGDDHGKVAQVQISNGATVASIQLEKTAPSDVDLSVIGIAVDNTGEQVAVTFFDSGPGSVVAFLQARDQKLSLQSQWPSAPLEPSCDRRAGVPSFAREGGRLVTYDTDCTVFDSFDLTADGWRPSGTVVFPEIIDYYTPPLVEDSQGEFWATTFGAVFRANFHDRTRQIKFRLSIDPIVLFSDPDGEQLYCLWPHPRQEGAALVDRDTGMTTRVDWNLGGVPYDGVAQSAILIKR